MKPATAVLCLVCFIACSSQKRSEEPKPTNGQSFAAAMGLVCNVDRHISSEGDDPLELDQRRSDFLHDRIKNPDAIYHHTLWRTKSNSERAKTIRQLAKEAKLESCLYADSLEDEAF
jgi:hypothetical protein